MLIVVVIGGDDSDDGGIMRRGRGWVEAVAAAVTAAEMVVVEDVAEVEKIAKVVVVVVAMSYDQRTFLFLILQQIHGDRAGIAVVSRTPNRMQAARKTQVYETDAMPAKSKSVEQFCSTLFGATTTDVLRDSCCECSRSL